MTVKIKPRERDAIKQSLIIGVVPSIGLHHIQVGRKDEVQAIINDFNRVAADSASIRFIIGQYGAGKSFFLNVARMFALEQGLVVAQADITMDRRLSATQGQARAMYSELMKNLATRANPTGGAIQNIIERFITDVEQNVRLNNGSDEDVKREIHQRLHSLKNFVSGYDFATVLSKYFEGFLKSDSNLTDAALRWLRAEYTTKTQANAELGVRTFIDDHNIYDYLKLMAAFTKIAGYKGLIINIDEMSVLSHRLSNKQARDRNYEIILTILNDCMQGNVSNLGFIFAGTDSFLLDHRRGIESYQPLAERLRGNRFAREDLKDFSGPVIRLANLQIEELYVLFQKIRDVFASNDPGQYLISDEAITKFLEHCYQTLGADAYLSPRESVMGFVGFLSVLDQNPEEKWYDLLSGINFDKSLKDTEDMIMDDVEDESGLKNDRLGDDLATLRL